MTPVEVLVAHQRHDIESCLCGWAVLGASHAQHQVDALEAAGWSIRPGPSKQVRIAAARARVAADLKRGVVTPAWIVELAREGKPDQMDEARAAVLMIDM